MSGGETPAPKVDAFVNAYCSGMRRDDAARLANISHATAGRLLADPWVAAQITEVRAETRRRVVDLLVAMQTTAISQLVRHASATVDPTAASSVSAARTLMSQACSWVEIEELRQRIDALEERAAGPASAEDRAARLAALRERLDGNGDESATDT